MSNLYGFKYSVSLSEDNYLSYIILSVNNRKSCIEKYQFGIKYHYDISDKIDDFCNEISGLGIEKWNMKDYHSSFYEFPHPHNWSFQISTDSLSVSCSGQEGVYPPKWQEFWKAFNRMCNGSNNSKS